jgi:hypothetical protein
MADNPLLQAAINGGYARDERAVPTRITLGMIAAARLPMGVKRLSGDRQNSIHGGLTNAQLTGNNLS